MSQRASPISPGLERATGGEDPLRWAWIRPADCLVLLTLGGFATLGSIGHVMPSVYAWLALTAAAVVAIAAWGERSRVGARLHDFAPIVWIVSAFELGGSVIGTANARRWDDTFRSLDMRLFGGLVDAWRGALGRPAWLTDLASVAYVAFYFVPLAIAIALYRGGRRAEFHRFAFVVQASFFAPYLGYALFPTLGPRVPIAEEAVVLGGGALSGGVRTFLHAVELNVLDAFPSGHTAVSLVVLAVGWRLVPKWRVPLVIVTSAILFATVYLSLHYVVDVVAGALVAGALLFVLRPLRPAPDA